MFEVSIFVRVLVECLNIRTVRFGVGPVLVGLCRICFGFGFGF